MATTVKRLFILSSVGLVLALILCGSGAPARPSTAQTPEATLEVMPEATSAETPEAASPEPPAAALPSTRPVIRAEVNAATVEGVPGSYCWPQPAPSAQCDLVDDPRPTESIAVAEGTPVKFLAEPAEPAPASWRAILLDDKGLDGNPRQTDLIDATFMVEGLSAGLHRLVAQAIYTGESAENQPYVEYAFLLEVGESVAMATQAATEVSTQAPTEAATPEAVVPPLVPTDTPAAPIETSVPVETMEATPESTAEGTAETPVAMTPEVSGTEEPTVEATQPVSTAEVAPTLIPSPTSVPLPTEAPTATVVPPTIPPVVTEQPTAAPVATEAAVPSTAPAQAVIVAGKSYDPIAVNACLPGATEPCTTRPYNAAAERIFASPGDTAQIVFKGPRPTAITVSTRSADGITLINQQSLPPDNLVLYIVQDMPGNFVLSVEIVWPQGKATYFYRLTVGS
jgi:hypothetical protein